MTLSFTTALKRTPTGIEGLDRVLQGGFIRNGTYLIVGGAGTGKTIFSLQFLVHGAVNLGEKGVYVALDEDYDEIVSGARTLGWHLDELIEEDKLSIIAYTPEFPDKIKGKVLHALVKTIVEGISKEIMRIEASRLAIDPLVPAALGYEEETGAAEYIRHLLLGLRRKVKCTTVVTMGVPTESIISSRFGVEEFLSTGVIMLGVKRIGRKLARVMYIRKMRWTPVKPIELEFDIVPGKGIEIIGSLQESGLLNP